jgi:hypothetical protein
VIRGEAKNPIRFMKHIVTRAVSAASDDGSLVIELLLLESRYAEWTSNPATEPWMEHESYSGDLAEIHADVSAP